MARGPRVNIYESQESAQAHPGSPHATPEMAGAGVARAIGGFASDVGAAGQEYLRQQEKERLTLERDDEERAKAGAAVALAQMGTHLDGRENAIRDETTGDPTGYAGRVADETRKASDSLLDKITHPKAKLYAETHLATFAAHRFQQAMTWERTRRDQWGSDNIVTATGAYSQEVARDPALYAPVRQALMDMIDVSVSPPLREKHRDAVDKALRLGTTVGDIARNPEGVYAATSKRLGIAPAVDPVKVAAEPARVEQTLQATAPVGLFDAVIHQESRGKHTDSTGALTRSSKGALGISQVMPATGFDPGYGVAPLKDQTEAEYRRFGQDYLNAMVREFKGDNAKALAAYNAGPGAVGAAVKRYGEHWLEQMPAETRAYVEMITARVAYPEPVKVAAADTGTMTDAGTGTQTLPEQPDAGVPGSGTQTVPMRAADADDPAGLPKGKSGVAHIDALTPEELVQARQQAFTAMERDRAVGKVELTHRVQDATAMAADGKRDPMPLTTSDFVRVHGPVEGTRLHYEYQQMQVVADDVKSMSGMSTPDIAALLKRTESAPGAGYFASEQRNALRIRAANETIKQREADGAAYVVKHAPSVKAAHDRIFGPALGPVGTPLWLDQDPARAPERNAAMADYLNKSMAEQQRLGIKATALLPAEAESYIVRGAQATSGSGDKMAAHINGLSQTFGDYWPAVYKQVVGGKHGASVPDSFIVIPGIASVAGREEVARLDGVKIDDLKKQVPSDVPKQVSEGVQSQLAVFFQTMMPNAGNTQTAKAMISAAEKIALSRVVGGASVGEATKQAATILVGHLDFPREGSTRSYAVPKGENSAVIAAGVRQASARIPLWNLPAPQDLSGARTDAEASEVWSTRVRARPMWVTSGDEKSLLLYTVGENGQPAAVRWQDGKQVSFDWNALREFAATAPTSQPTQVPPGKRGAPAYTSGGLVAREQDERAAAEARRFREDKKAGQ